MPDADNLALARSEKLKKTALVNPLVGEIATGLLALGGSAHRDEVMNFVAAERGAALASAGLRAELIEAFELHLESALLEGREPLFELPFGAGSRRWRLSHDAHAHLRGVHARRA